MRILVVRVCETIAGAEIYNLNLIKGFNKYFPAVEFLFITTLPEFGRRIEKYGIKTFLLSVFNKEIGTKKDLLKLLLYLPKYLFYFLKTFFISNLKKKIDLVCLQGMTEKIVLTPILKVFGFRILWLEHGPVFTFPKTKLILFLYKIISNLTNKIITASYDAKKDLVKNGIEDKKIISISTAVDVGVFSPVPRKDKYKIKRKWKIKKNRKIIGYTGTINEAKGINDFIEIGKLLNQKFKNNVKFFLVGCGPDLERVKKQVKRDKLEDIFTFFGFQEDVRPYLGIFDLFLFPTHHFEASSLSLLEAMSMGIPVVARDIGGNRELVVHGKTGCLFKDESPEEVAEIIVGLLKDKKKREAMGKAARERVKKYFNEERWIKELHKVFEEVVRK